MLAVFPMLVDITIIWSWLNCYKVCEDQVQHIWH